MKALLVLLAAVAASVAPMPALAWDSSNTAALLGGVIIGGQLYQPRPYYPAQQQYYGGGNMLPPAYQPVPMYNAPSPIYGGGYGQGQQYRSAPRIIYVPGTTVVVQGATDNGNGTCTQSNGSRGVMKDGACFVPNRPQY